MKQWDATLDGATRQEHRALDGQIRETDEKFTYGKYSAMYPGGFNVAKMDIRCRCMALTIARWMLDDEELERLKERAAYFGLDKTKDFEDYKKKYLKAAETVEKSGKSGIIKVPDAKLTEYALDPEKQPDKAKAFELALGYNLGNAGALKENIIAHVDESKFVERGDNGYGMRYQYVMALTGPNGKTANVLTAWIRDGEELRMTSVYVTDKKVDE